MNDTLPSPHRASNANEIDRLRDDTIKLIAAGAKRAAQRLVESLAPAPAARDDPAMLVDNLKQDADTALAAFRNGGAHSARAAHRFACDMLRLHRVCARERCRKAQTCRGDPAACHARARVPEPVQEWVTLQLAAELMPWLPLLASRHAAERTAYECWIAGLEARR